MFKFKLINPQTPLMKKAVTLSVFGFLMILNTLSSFAQKGTEHFTGTAATKFYKGASQVFVNEKRNTISFIRLKEDQPVSEKDAKEWLQHDVLKLNPDGNLIQYQQFNDKVGYSHIRYREYYKGVPVEDGVYYVHSKDGVVRSANGEWYDGISISTKPSINPSQAYQAACQHINAKVWMHEREEAINNQLVILPLDGIFALVYKCDVYARDPYKREWVYVDAQNGSIVKTESRIQDIDVPGTAITAYSGTHTIIADNFQADEYRLREVTHSPGIETYDFLTGADITDGDNIWTFGGALNDYAIDAHYGAEATYDYYNDNYGWKSVDGNGAQKLFSYINNNGAGSINAFWDGIAMNYGQGDIGSGVTPLTSLDVCGHELTHGVTENSSGLNYSCESGGINESMSDIFGVTIRFLNIPNGTWFIGDQFNDIFRNMASPNDYGNPDCYDGLYWSNCPEVHSGSGVGNFWYYLLTEGGAGVNDIGNSYYVTGLGLTDAAAIAFRANTVYMTPNSEYADLYDLSVQSAKDLYGDCSNQTIQTAAAGYAVNIGPAFQDAVTAIFASPQTSYCTLSSAVSFVNTSYNGTSYVWDFGDGTTSTDVNPTHTYTATGTYTVSLIVNGVSLCNTSDTLVKTDYITIDNIGQPVSPSCAPATVTPSTNFGIFNVQFKDINNASIGSTEGYKDFSCAAFTHLVAGDPYVLTVSTGPGKSEDLRVWIDYNGDGIFNNTNELIYQDDAVTDTHTGIIYTPSTVVLNTSLRMRVMDDKAANNITDACYSPIQGQAEDYAVVFETVNAAPVADFTSNLTSVNFGQSVNYFDLSANVPTSWEWHFEGGIPATSTLQNPTNIQYNTPGTYDVTLIATNSFGSNTITKPDYITVNSEFNMCTVSSVSLESGAFYDSGGPTGNYSNNENCSLLITPPCAASITLSFSYFQSQANNDILKVYDGPDASAPLILTVSGSPFPLPSVTGTNGQLFITWISNSATTNGGFTANFTSVVGGTVTPVALYTVNNANPPLNTAVDFTDLSSNSPIHWEWDFGDGGTSALKNPSHTYTTSGTYEVKLIASNCGGADSVIKDVIVQAAPAMVIDPPTVTVNLTCSTNSVTVPITISNDGGGDLVYNATESEYNFQGSEPNILALTYGADLAENYPNTINAIDQTFPNYTLSTVNTINSDTLAAALQGKNVCLITKPTGIPTDYLNFAVPLQNFVNNGGTVIFCGASSGKVDCIFNTGLLSGSYGALGTNNTLNVVNTSHPLTQGIGAVINEGPKFTYALNLSGIDVNKLIDYTGSSVLAYRDQGYGHVVYIGFDYKIANDTASKVIGNAMSWVNSMLVGDWLTLSPSGGGTINAGGSQVVNVTVSNDGLSDGTYTEYIVVTSNDPNNPSDTIVCTINVDATDCLTFEAIQSCEGQVCFDDSVQTGATSVSWSFGDGATSTQNDPCHTYSTTGTYNVQLIACGSAGCDTVDQTITVAILSANVQYSPATVFENEIVSFTSNSSGAVSWSWDFGDGGNSTQENPSHAYLDAGTYTVVLTATDANGCTVTSSQVITILPVGIGDVSGFQLNLNLYPNPFNTEAYIEYTLPQQASVNIELWNELGQKVSSVLPETNQEAGKYVYPLSATEAGVYMVRFAAGDVVLWKKLVKVQ